MKASEHLKGALAAIANQASPWKEELFKGILQLLPPAESHENHQEGPVRNFPIYMADSREHARSLAEKKLAEIRRRYPSATELKIEEYDADGEPRFILSYRHGGARFAARYDFPVAEGKPDYKGFVAVAKNLDKCG